MQDDEFEAPGRRPSFDYAAFGLWYDRCYESVLRPSLARAEATVDALLRDSLAERDLARIRRHAGRVKTKQRLWRKLCQPRYVARIDTVEDIPAVIDDLVGVRLTCTNRRDIDTVREVFDALPTARADGSILWLDSDSERDYLERPRPSGYRGWHINLKFADDLDSGSEVTCELQVRTLLQDGWGELTHEDTYKKDGELPPLVEVLSRRMADLLATLDDIAEDVRDELDRLDEAAVDGWVDDASNLAVPTAPRLLEQEGEVRRFLESKWNGLDRPVGLAALAWEIQRDHGPEVATDWFGHGSFKQFLTTTLPNGEITPGRHAYLLPRATEPDDLRPDPSVDDAFPPRADIADAEASPSIPPAALALHRVDRTFPLLHRHQWSRLFLHLSEAWSRIGEQKPSDRLTRRLVQSTCARSARTGGTLAARHVEPVVRDLTSALDGRPAAAEDLADTYATMTQHRMVELRLMGQRNRGSRASVRQWIATPADALDAGQA